MTTSSPELRPCAHCGREVFISQALGGYLIECSCGISTKLYFACGEDPLPLLREAWNRRASEQPQACPGCGDESLSVTTELHCFGCGGDYYKDIRQLRREVRSSALTKDV